MKGDMINLVNVIVYDMLIPEYWYLYFHKGGYFCYPNWYSIDKYHFYNDKNSNKIP